MSTISDKDTLCFLNSGSCQRKLWWSLTFPRGFVIRWVEGRLTFPTFTPGTKMPDPYGMLGKSGAQLFSVASPRSPPPHHTPHPPLWPHPHPSPLSYSYCPPGAMYGPTVGEGRRGYSCSSRFEWLRCKSVPFKNCLLQTIWPMRAQQALKWASQWMRSCLVYKQWAETSRFGWHLFWPWWTGSNPKDCYLCSCLVCR